MVHAIKNSTVLRYRCFVIRHKSVQVVKTVALWPDGKLLKE